MSERLTLPVLPLRDMVLFPGVTTPVGAGRPATLRAIEAALKTESRLIFAVAQRENVDTVSPALLYGLGTIARIGQVQRGLGGVQLVLHGEKRAAALQYAERAGHLEVVVVEALEQPPINPTDPAFVALFREARAARRSRSGLPRYPHAGTAGTARAVVRRGAAAPGARARAATDRRPQRPGGHQVPGAGGVGPAAARDDPARAT